MLLQAVLDDAKASQDATPADGDFSTVGGIQTKAINFNGQEVDVTSGSSNEWRELLDGRGVRSFDISGSGIADDSDLLKKIEQRSSDNKITWWRINRSDQDRKYTGKFKASFNNNGAHDGAVNFELSLMSSGPVVIS